MKPIKKIKYLGFWPDLNKKSFCISNILYEKYDLVESDDPDYVICSAFGKPYCYCKYDGVRIFYSGENFAPDFNLVDYAIGSDNITFGDRYIRFSDAFSPELSHKKRGITLEDLKQKKYFANFVVGHESEHNLRGDFFKLLSSTYKRVESAGSFLNNMPDGKSVSRLEKDGFVKQCKFTLCFESTQYPDFTTEKIVDAFKGNTIPVYLGNPNICDIFNPDAFIHVTGRDDFNRAIEQIKYLDQNDEAYLEMLSQPIYVRESLVDEEINKLRDFLFNIFDQPLESAGRRTKVYMPKAYETWLYDKFNGTLVNRKSIKNLIKSKFAAVFPELYRKYQVKKYGLK